MIRIRELEVKYRWREEPVLRRISADFRRKGLILGPNGSGKTTLFRAICGLTNISGGEILIDGRNSETIFGAPGLISANFPEIYGLLNMKARDVILLYSDLVRGDPNKALLMLNELGVDEGLLRKRKLRELSAGQLKAVSTSLALSSNSLHVLLDEPFEQLDPARKRRLVGFLEEHEGIVLLNTHETWLLKDLRGWEAWFVVEGRMFGPVEVEELLSMRITVGEEAGAILKLQASGKIVSLVREEKGTLLSSLESLDRIYELI